MYNLQMLLTMQHPIIIVGTGLAGYQLAREFRRTNSTLPLTIITADDGRFYPKPKLSNALTQGQTAEQIATASATDMAAQLNATLYTHCTVEHINTKTKEVFFKDKILPYAKLVLAVGADVIKPPLQGNAESDILYVNHIDHYAAFINMIKNKKSIAILGAGLIGCEFANDLSNAGYEVHVIAPALWPLDLLIPEAIGKLLQNALVQNGVQFYLQCVANQINKENDKFKLTLSNGNHLEVDCVLSAIGLRPHIELAKHAGIKVNRGIIVNRYLETSEPDTYALGDCAEVEGHVLPYITPILNCARSLAKTLAGAKTAAEYPAMPVIVKTPAHPIAVCPPPKNMKGQWDIQTEQQNTKALFYAEQKLYGFVLTNEAVKERMALAKQLPVLF